MTPDTLELSYDDKVKLAKDPNTSQESLAVLATDKYWSVREWVAQHQNTSQETLKLLATDKNPDVRYWVARNPNYKNN